MPCNDAKHPDADPLVSVLIPVFNGEAYIKAAVISALQQDYPNIEVIIVDDGSTDGTHDLLEQLMAQDQRIMCHRFPTNQGFLSARNMTLKLARGEYVTLLDADDVFLAGKITKQVQFLNENPAYGLVGANCFVVDAFGKRQGHITYPESHDEILKAILLFQPFRQSCIMLRRDLLDKLGGFDEENAVDDYEFFMRFARRWKVHNLQMTLAEYRLHDRNLTRVRQNEMLRGILAAKLRAVFKYGYRPTLPACASFMATLVMLGLPNDLVLRIGTRYLTREPDSLG